MDEDYIFRQFKQEHSLREVKCILYSDVTAAGQYTLGKV